VNKNRNWIKSQLIKSGEQETSIFGLDKYLEISNFIAEVFKEEISSKEKENSPFFAKLVKKKQSNLFLSWQTFYIFRS
jgi:hypothetical protein